MARFPRKVATVTVWAVLASFARVGDCTAGFHFVLEATDMVLSSVFGSLTTASLVECCSICLEMQECGSVSFNRDTNDCWFSNVTKHEVQQEAVNQTGYNIFTKGRSQTAWNRRVVPDHTPIRMWIQMRERERYKQTDRQTETKRDGRDRGRQRK